MGSMRGEARLVGVQKTFEFVKVDVLRASEVVPHVHSVIVLIIQRHGVD